jgi:hypothetical protein
MRVSGVPAPQMVAPAAGGKVTPVTNHGISLGDNSAWCTDSEGRVTAVSSAEFDQLRVCSVVGPGGMMIIPPQGVAIRITGLPEGGCRVEAIPEIRQRVSKGDVRIGVRKQL